MLKLIQVNEYTYGILFGSLLVMVLLYMLKNGRWVNKNIVKRRRITMNKTKNDLVTLEDDGLESEVIIVGAGVAGAALAYALGKEGRRVLVLERDITEPDRIVGELLQPGGYLKLIELGLEDCVENIDAQRLAGYFIFKDGKSTKLSYPLDMFKSDVAGRGFHNGRFVQRMREKAAKLPSVKLEQGTVTSLIQENGIIQGVKYKTKTGHELQTFAPLTIVCDGCFSNLRRSLCKPKVQVLSYSVALILKNCKLPDDNHGHIILADPSPIWFYPISSTEVRCFADIPGQKIPSIANGAMKKYLKTMVLPSIPPTLHEAFITAIESGNIRTMPNHILPANPHPTPGALLLGDSLNMRPSIAGGGMTVALSDVSLIHNLLKELPDLRDSTSIRLSFETFYILRKPMAFTLNTIAAALQNVFSESHDGGKKEIRQVIFDYVSLGGVCSTGVIALLSGLNPSPHSFTLHFFAAGIYGVGRLLLPFPWPRNLWIAARIIWGAKGIIFPIIRAEGIRKMFLSSAYYRAIWSATK